MGGNLKALNLIEMVSKTQHMTGLYQTCAEAATNDPFSNLLSSFTLTSMTDGIFVDFFVESSYPNIIYFLPNSF